MARLAACRREDRHNLHVPASALRANEIEQPGNVNEYCFIRQADFIKGQLCPMAAFDAPAMDRETGFACRSGFGYRLRWLAGCHVAGLAQCGGISSANAHEHARAKSAAREGAGQT